MYHPTHWNNKRGRVTNHPRTQNFQGENCDSSWQTGMVGYPERRPPAINSFHLRTATLVFMNLVSFSFLTLRIALKYRNEQRRNGSHDYHTQNDPLLTSWHVLFPSFLSMKKSHAFVFVNASSL